MDFETGLKSALKRPTLRLNKLAQEKINEQISFQEASFVMSL